MTRGNQRDLARQKNLKKQAASGKGSSLPEGMTLAQKKEADAEIMRQKAAAAKAKKDAETAAASASAKK